VEMDGIRKVLEENAMAQMTMASPIQRLAEGQLGHTKEAA
jgi:hypothetical protein